MSNNPTAKALRDKLSHLRTGRDSHTPVHDKTQIKDINMPSMPSMKTPKAPIMAKSDHDDSLSDEQESGSMMSNEQEANEEPGEAGGGNIMMKEQPLQNTGGGYCDLLKAFDLWKAKEASYRNMNFKKSKEPLMKPFKSDAQRRAMYAAAEGESNIGIPKKIGKEFISDSKDQDQSKLPERIQKSDGMCKSDDLKSNLHCLCDECRHDSALMGRLKIKCACDSCCEPPVTEDDTVIVFEKSLAHPETCRCESCRVMLKKKKQLI
jgi:hypothetical protein